MGNFDQFCTCCVVEYEDAWPLWWIATHSNQCMKQIKNVGFHCLRMAGFKGNEGFDVEFFEYFVSTLH